MKRRPVLIHSKRGIADAARLLADRARVSETSRWAKRVVEHLPKNVTSKLDHVVEAVRATFGTKIKLASVRDAVDGTTRVNVGVWSLEAWLGELVQLLEELNRVQSAFAFYEVQAAVPAGLISRPERVIPWLEGLIGKAAAEQARNDIQDNLIANDFFGLAEDIRTDLQLDYVIGVTPSMVAQQHNGQVYWNHFSTYSNKTILVSSYQLHHFAKLADRPFNAFLAKVIASQLLVATRFPILGFHENRGCLFDYDADRVSLIDKVIEPKIESQCLSLIEPQYRQAALSFVDFIRLAGNTEP